jgi:hypothetical protein
MFAVFTIAGCVAAGVVTHRTHEAPSLCKALLIAGAVVAALMWGGECDQRGLSAYWALGDLVALVVTANKCTDALALCASSAAADAVRKALASGRQLYLFDYIAMCAAAVSRRAIQLPTMMQFAVNFTDWLSDTGELPRSIASSNQFTQPKVKT